MRSLDGRDVGRRADGAELVVLELSVVGGRPGHVVDQLLRPERRQLGHRALAARPQHRVVGDEPGLRFEVTRGGGILPSYPVDSRDAFGAPPPPKNGQHYVKVSYPSTLVGGGMDVYTEKNKPYMDFMKDVVAKYPTGGPRGGLFMGDYDNQAAIIRGMGVPIPPATNRGHFHIQNDEFWFILEGKIAYEVEGKGLIVSQAGDVVLALPGRFHRAGWAPGQMDTRLAFNRSPSMQHNYAEDANGTQ